MQKIATLSFRTSLEFAEQASFYAEFLGLSKTAYIEQAILEKNERAMAMRLQFLSSQLSAKSLEENVEMDAALGDGLVQNHQTRRNLRTGL
jgi:hypothetical protein